MLLLLKTWYHRLPELASGSPIQVAYFAVSGPESLSNLPAGNQTSRPFFIAFIYIYSNHIVNNVFIVEYLENA